MNVAQPLIAVVDDEASVSIALRRLLRSAKLAVETFASGVAFLSSLQNHVPDCVVLDLHMPQMDGFEVQRRLAQAGARVPVIIITGRDTLQARERALAGGAAAYLLKPVDDQALLGAIAVAIAPTPQEEPTLKVPRREG
ncbi:MAG: response regulator [Verrucomicrobia bacterium]|nr:response regulator [Verrucomicrobiota bacterium]